MANKAFSLRDSSLWVVDGTANTPNYVQMLFREGGGDLPLGHARGEEELILNQGKADANMHRMRKDDKPIYEPIGGSVSGLLYDNKTHLLLIPALSNPFTGTWTVGAATTYTPVTSPGTIVNIDNTAVTAATPVDHEAKNMVNLEFLWTGDSANWGLKYQACHIPPDTLKVSDGFPTKISFAFKCYGAISKITAHVTPATETTS